MKRLGLYLVFVVLLAACIGGAYVAIVGLRGQPAPSESRPSSSPAVTESAQPAQAALELADEAVAVWKQMNEALKGGDEAAAWRLCVSPEDDAARDQVHATMQQWAGGELIDAKAAGDWAVLALHRASTDSPVAMLTMLRDDDQWRIVPESAFADRAIMQRIDESYDALSGWMQGQLGRWESKYASVAAQGRDVVGAQTASATEREMSMPGASPSSDATDEPKEQAAKPADVEAAKAALIEALTAANAGDYTKAGELLDVSRVAKDEDGKAFWDGRTRNRVLKPETIKVRRASPAGDGHRLMLRMRLSDGNSWTVKVDVQHIDGRWAIVKAY